MSLKSFLFLQQRNDEQIISFMKRHDKLLFVNMASINLPFLNADMANHFVHQCDYDEVSSIDMDVAVFHEWG
jgi:hypothetical protein